MQAWRRAFREDEARFVCICVDGRAEATAREFQRLYFQQDMINAFIDAREDFPRFETQLGCQGLVVFDAEGRFATQRSPAFLDQRGDAFRVVESAVRSLASSRSIGSGHRHTSDVHRTEKVSIARFAENACLELPTSLDDTEALVAMSLPTVGHPEMDADHAEIGKLMRRAFVSREARDVHALFDAFQEHAAEEEVLLRDAENNGACGVNEGGARAPDAFRASSSHASDHARVLSELRAVTSATDMREGETISLERFHLACRSIVEHAMTYDSAYAGKLAA
jgi:hypothetical protein